jgi:hypothetical protein
MKSVTNIIFIALGVALCFLGIIFIFDTLIPKEKPITPWALGEEATIGVVTLLVGIVFWRKGRNGAKRSTP